MNPNSSLFRRLDIGASLRMEHQSRIRRKAIPLVALMLIVVAFVFSGTAFSQNHHAGLVTLAAAPALLMAPADDLTDPKGKTGGKAAKEDKTGIFSLARSILSGKKTPKADDSKGGGDDPEKDGDEEEEEEPDPAQALAEANTRLDALTENLSKAESRIDQLTADLAEANKRAEAGEELAKRVTAMEAREKTTSKRAADIAAGNYSANSDLPPAGDPGDQSSDSITDTLASLEGAEKTKFMRENRKAIEQAARREAMAKNAPDRSKWAGAGRED